ncbi:MAG: adenosylcobinamide-GDP ribazoletransferase [Candidatus Aquicultorales bacterium]
MKSLFLAISFLTAIPVTVRDPDVHVGRSAAFFPLVGLLIGGVLAVLDYVAGLAFPGPARSAFLVAALALLTNGLHLDGLADTADGLSSRDPSRALEIMKDSRIGAFGVAAVTIDLILKYALIISLPAERSLALLVFPVVSRWAMALSVSWVVSPRGDGGLAGWYSTRASAAAAVVSSGLTISIVGVLIGLKALPVLMLGFVAAAVFMSYMRARIGGMTGDSHGALNELIELVALAVMVAVPF